MTAHDGHHPHTQIDGNEIKPPKLALYWIHELNKFRLSPLRIHTAHTMLQNIKSRSKFQCRTTNFSLPLPLSFLFLVPLTKYLLQPIFFPTFRSLLWDEYQSSISQWLELIHGHRKFPIKFIIEFEEAKNCPTKGITSFSNIFVV